MQINEHIVLLSKVSPTVGKYTYSFKRQHGVHASFGYRYMDKRQNNT